MATISKRPRATIDYSVIIKGLEEAEGPNMYLDAFIVGALVPDAIIESYPTAADNTCVFHAQTIGIENKSPLPAFTSSLDTAVTLVEKVLPGWAWSVYNHPKPRATLIMQEYLGDPFVEPYTGEKGTTSAIALLIAMFKALQETRQKQADIDEAMMTKYSYVIRKLEEAEGADQVLDLLVWDAVGHPPGHYWNGKAWTDIAPFTFSLDAAVALVEKKLPGWKKQFFESREGTWIARVSSPRYETFSTDYMRERDQYGSPNGAIAILIAMFLALREVKR